jgi:hypothetical protein
VSLTGTPIAAPIGADPDHPSVPHFGQGAIVPAGHEGTTHGNQVFGRADWRPGQWPRWLRC